MYIKYFGKQIVYNQLEREKKNTVELGYKAKQIQEEKNYGIFFYISRYMGSNIRSTLFSQAILN